MRAKAPATRRAALQGLSLTVLLSAGSLIAGEKIQFSGRAGAPAAGTPVLQEKSKFDAPQFLDVTTRRADPFTEIVPTQPGPMTSAARHRAKKANDSDDWAVTDGGKERERDLSDGSRGRGMEFSFGNARDKLLPPGKDTDNRGKRPDGGPAHASDDTTSTNRFGANDRDGSFRFGQQRDNSSGSQGGSFSQKSPGLTLRLPQESGLGVRARPGLLSLEWRGDGQGQSDRGWQVSVSGASAASGRRVDGASLPGYLTRGEEQPFFKPNLETMPGGKRGLLDAGGNTTRQPGGLAAPLNDFSSVAGMSLSPRPAASSAPPELPRFEPKPAVLEIPKRQY